MRWIALLITLSSPAAAWEFQAGRPCVLKDAQPEATVRLTHDPIGPEYSITVTATSPWVGGPIFALAFIGENPLRITTNRHVISPDGLSVTVTDRGFGNVLNGMEFNTKAIASLGAQDVEFDLDGVKAPMQPFRICAIQPLATRAPLTHNAARIEYSHG